MWSEINKVANYLVTGYNSFIGTINGVESCCKVKNSAILQRKKRSTLRKC